MDLLLFFNFCTQVIYILSFVYYAPASVGDYVFPAWGEAIGWILTMSSICIVIGYGSILVYYANGTVIEVSILYLRSQLDQQCGFQERLE